MGVSDDKGVLTWCTRCSEFTPCEVMNSPFNGLRATVYGKPRKRHRHCSSCEYEFTTYEVNQEDWRQLMDFRIRIESLENAHYEIQKILDILNPPVEDEWPTLLENEAEVLERQEAPEF